MRVLMMAACALVPAPLAAQTATPPPLARPPMTGPQIPLEGPLGDPAPLDGAKGVDTDLLCLTVVLPLASAESKAGKPDAMLDGARNFFMGRITARRDQKQFAGDLAAMAPVRFTKSEQDVFASNCLRRYVTGQMDIMFSVARAMPDRDAVAKRP